MNSTALSKTILTAFASCLLLGTRAQAQQSNLLNGATVVSYSKQTGLPNFLKLAPNIRVAPATFQEWIHAAYGLDESISFRSYEESGDEYGFTHIRYKEYVGDLPLENTMLIVHIRNGIIEMINGTLYTQVGNSMSAVYNEQEALKKALGNIHALHYKWENKIETEAMRAMLNDPGFTYEPKGELVVVRKDGNDYSASSLRLAWKFNIYAEEPLSRNNVYVDAQTGEVIAKQSLIHNADVVGSATTVYSGTVTMTCDNTGPNAYRLQETGRGNGIKTFNMNNTTTYSSTDFTNTSSTWNLAPPNKAAEDAHWGAEKTYDYYSQVHSRNSIDGNGYNLLSYVHYSNNYVNAFWDGTRMTYGDGNTSQGFTIMTGLDVCGHEITHGLTSFTAGLNGPEGDALNEGWSDIMGTTIERFARPSQWDWIIGADITTNGQGIRLMSNPNAHQQPDTYMGTYWDPNNEPHNNNGPSIFWYYLLCQGGSGTNDINNAYNVTGITMNSARLIAFRGLTVYATPNTDYADMRTCTIQAANDIFGGCTPEVIATTNAWYAVGVGPAFSATVNAAFTANSTTSCVVPFTVNFTNTSTNASLATWNFGDNTTSTQINPSHTYTNPGTYTVKLVASGACGTDSVIQTSYITVNPPVAPTTTGASSCTPASLNLSASGNGTLKWYTTSTGGTPIQTGTTYTTPVLNNTTTYYVESQIPGTTGNAGPVNHTFGTGGYHNNTSTQYEIFDVMQPCTLQTVWVDAGAAGNRTFTLWDNAGNVINNYTVNCPNGTSTVTLNIPLTPGTGYRLGGTQMNLYRNNAGATYPYNLNGVVSITGSSAGSGFYYYAYNWQLVTAPCISLRTPCTATIGGPTVTYTAASYDTLCVNTPPVTLTGGSPANGTYSGTGVSNGVFDPSVAGVGNWVITYSYTQNNCTGTATQTIHVDVCAGVNAATVETGLAVYPNPSTGNITVEVGLSRDEHAQLQLMNSIGQQVLDRQFEWSAGNNKITLDLSSLAKGIYYIQVKTSTDVVTKRIDLN